MITTGIPNDEALLRRFYQDGDEEAFEILAKRYQGLVYHTALRSTGDAELSLDVCQAVFLLLAKKARTLHAEGGLAGWLHRAAILEARSASRREARRRVMLRDFETQIQTSPMTFEPSMHPALPLLDEALNRLPGPDREVLLGHYYHGWTYGEIARRQQESEAAVQRRASRAVEKLSQSLRRAGVLVPASIIAAGLPAVLQIPAPDKVLAALSAGALAAGPVAGAPLLAKAAALILAGCSSCALGYAVSPSIAMESSLETAERVKTEYYNGINGQLPDIPLTGPVGTWQEIVSRAEAALGSYRSEQANARATWHLKALTTSELKSALLWAKALEDKDKGAILGSLMLSLRAKENPALAWTEQVELFDREHGHREPALVRSAARIARELWDRDPAAVLDRLTSQQKPMHMLEGAEVAAQEIASTREGLRMMHHMIGQMPDEAARARAVSEIFSMGDPADNIPWLIGMTFADETARRRLVVTSLWRTDSDGKYDSALAKWLDALPPETAAAYREDLSAALLAQPEDWRLPVSRRIKDPELRLAVQKSL